MTDAGYGIPIEHFIQAITSQLDRAQVALSAKARAGLPLTFAVKDISLELRAFVDFVGSEVLIRPAGPGETDASVLHLSLTTITRPMIEENTLSLQPDEPSLKEVLGEDVTDEERRRLEWAGIHTVSQLRKIQREKGEQVIEQIANIPAMRLRGALQRASHPHISRISRDGASRLRIRGFNLRQDDEPVVHIDGERVPVLESGDNEIVVTALGYPESSTLVIETGPDMITETVIGAAAAHESWNQPDDYVQYGGNGHNGYGGQA